MDRERGKKWHFEEAVQSCVESFFFFFFWWGDVNVPLALDTLFPPWPTLSCLLIFTTLVNNQHVNTHGSSKMQATNREKDCNLPRIYYSY